MNPVTDLRGIITVMNTPFTEEGGIDADSFRRGVRHAVEGGVVGILVPAMAAEVGRLDRGEKILLARLAVEEAAGRIPIIGGTSAPTRAERIAMAGEMIRAGCRAVLVNIPHEDDRVYTEEVAEVAALNPGFIMIQDWDAAGIGLPDALILRLFREVELFKCLKVEVVPAGIKYSRILAATEGRLHFSGGWAVSQMIEGLDRGVHAFMPTGLHEIYTRIERLHRGGRRDEAVALFRRIAPLLGFSNQHLDISIHFFKRLLHRQGIFTTDRVREPITPFDSHHRRIADELIDDVLPLLSPTVRPEG